MQPLTEPSGAPPLPAGYTVADLARDHALELLRFAYLLCGDRVLAEDLLQDALLGMHRRFPGRLAVDNPVGYACRAMANANVNRLRRRSSSELVVDPVPDHPAVGAHNADDAAERDVLWRALRRLPARQRTVLVLRFYNDATDVEIADALGCRRGTVRSLASRALAVLRTDTDITEGGRS
jgi:RNA polymerase sigma-70 factor (sigma-E family)